MVKMVNDGKLLKMLFFNYCFVNFDIPNRLHDGDHTLYQQR
jgi:hypothetical protein